MTELKTQNEIVGNRVTTIDQGIKPPVSSPMEIMAEAVQRGMGKDQLEVLERMFELDLKVKAQQAKEAYLTSFADFKLEAPDVIMDKINKQTGNSKYSSTGNFLKTVNPALAEHGLTARFKIDDITNPTLITVTCVLSHKLGHSQESSMSSEPDNLGPKGTPNKTMIHGRMSTLTQLMRATYSAVTGMYAIDKKYDDDGNMAGKKEKINDIQYSNIIDLLAAINRTEAAFCKYMKIDDIKNMPLSMYETAVKELEVKKS